MDTIKLLKEAHEILGMCIPRPEDYPHGPAYAKMSQRHHEVRVELRKKIEGLSNARKMGKQ